MNSLQSSSLQKSNQRDVVDFFTNQLRKLCNKYPESYTQEDFDSYTSSHQEEELNKKAEDPTYFFRIIKDQNDNVIAYFESKQTGKAYYSDTQCIQWIFIDEKHQGTGLARQMWTEFEDWCKTHGYKSIWSFVALKNTISIEIHRKLM
jgi:GNAT superfamily N-acetyltransferase